MKRYLLFMIVLAFCFGLAASIYADSNDFGDPNTLSDPNQSNEPNIPDVFVKTIVADSNQSDVLVIDPNVTSEPNEPNEPASKFAAPVKTIGRRRVKAVRFSVSAAVDLPEFKYRLLPLDMERDDGDAGERYAGAIEALPADYSDLVIQGMLDAAMGEFDVSGADRVVKACRESLELIRQGGLLRQCQWVKDDGGKDSFSLLEGLNNLTSLVALKVRLDTSSGQYKKAVGSIRDGLAMARHIANSDSIVQAIAGANTASVMLKGVEELVQSSKAPSLYRSLGDLPKPLVNLNRTAAMTGVDRLNENSKKRRRSEMRSGIIPGRMGGKGRYRLYYYDDFGDEPEVVAEDPRFSRDEITLRMNELDRLVAALQCLEGIRYYAAVNGGKLPESLNDVSDLSLPVDPVTQMAFSYCLYEGKALLGSPVTQNQADVQSTIFFELRITNDE